MSYVVMQCAPAALDREMAASNHRQQVPPMSELKKVLRTSKTRRFVDASRAVNSALASHQDRPDQGKTVRCWIFEAPNQSGR